MFNFISFRIIASNPCVLPHQHNRSKEAVVSRNIRTLVVASQTRYYSYHELNWHYYLSNGLTSVIKFVVRQACKFKYRSSYNCQFPVIGREPQGSGIDRVYLVKWYCCSPTVDEEIYSLTSMTEVVWSGPSVHINRSLITLAILEIWWDGKGGFFDWLKTIFISRKGSITKSCFRCPRVHILSGRK